ncbi:hypothetical protein SDRG_09315 [Saprolegnia diclina VS20]|uniref:PDZ domain-containing protein n=1 Tax=Saprolegnia diclina (strain VS20) TaxID=1156394 RepID=T0Q645_SAPDV|nr:hypothetical protein SDRG_09315 [Saprolegnia diclina VS20]EQC33339.1 hypothetical protein SDRG_09315 [Saprolegnia diclina VS20]|eukprot:XP_008613462.1 hypothetical protein SDRG_09315 [Saprolegnia diclina VS20]
MFLRCCLQSRGSDRDGLTPRTRHSQSRSSPTYSQYQRYVLSTPPEPSDDAFPNKWLPRCFPWQKPPDLVVTESPVVVRRPSNPGIDRRVGTLYRYQSTTGYFDTDEDDEGHDDDLYQLVRLHVPPGPSGLILVEPDSPSSFVVPTVAGFEPVGVDSRGRPRCGVIELSGEVLPGSILVSVDRHCVLSASHGDVCDLLAHSEATTAEFLFQSIHVHDL